MKLNEFVVADAIVPDLQAASKEDAIRAMVTSLKKSGAIPEADEEGIISAILKREELGSTGIGNGVAVPHTKHPSVDRLVATVALSRLASISRASTAKTFSFCFFSCRLRIAPAITFEGSRTSLVTCVTRRSAVFYGSQARRRTSLISLTKLTQSSLHNEVRRCSSEMLVLLSCVD